MMIYLPRNYVSRVAGREELVNAGVCSKCGRQYSWKVQFLRQYAKAESEEEYNRTRAMQLFKEYRERGIGHCCASKEHRSFIAKNTGAVLYE